MKKYTLPSFLENQISELLRRTPLAGKTLTLDSAKELAACVQKLSDFYITCPASPTPWKESWAQIAIAVFYLPLNYLRNQRVIEEGHRWGFFEGLQMLIDFGAGPGTSSWALRDFFQANKLSFPSTHWVESAMVPHWLDLFQGTSSSKDMESFLQKNPNGKKLGIFSYSLTELQEIPVWLNQFEALMILEPSTQEDGRRLQALREPLMAQGFSLWAPCTHEKPCPLLAHSKKDWCHDRIFVEMTKWFLRMESLLPWKNNTLTLSYLLAHKKPRPLLSMAARVVGDTLEEKGKTRQMICKDEQRLFLTWMKKEVEAEFIPRGSLIEGLCGHTQVSNELRVKMQLKWS